jgi:sirohydrochlorin cobaltochelatase
VTTANSALILFAHGSRDPQWAAPFRTLQAQVAAKKPGLTVELAFLEIMRPSLIEVVDKLVGAGTRRAIVAPLFMAQGAHLKRDLTGTIESLRERHKELTIEVLPALGDVDVVMDAMSTWLADSAAVPAH